MGRPTVNRGGRPGVVLTLYYIMSTVRNGGSAAADPVRACLSWAWAAVPGLRACLRHLFRAYTLSPLVTLSPHALFRCSSRFHLVLIPSASIHAERARRSRFRFAFLGFISVFLRIFSVILCFLAVFLRYSLLLSVRTSDLLFYILYYYGASYLGARFVMGVYRVLLAWARRAFLMSAFSRGRSRV